MTGTGIGFDFSQLMTQFANLDAELKKLTASGKTFGDSMKAVFAGMTKGDFKNFADQIKQLRGDVVAFGKVKVGLNWDSTSLQNYINDVNRLILVIKQVREGAKGSHELKGTGISIQGLKKELKDAQELLAIVKKVEQQTKRSQYDRNTSFAGATNYSDNAVSVQQHAKAVEYLTAARQKLKTTDADYLNKLEDLNTRIQKHNDVLRRSKQTSKEAADESRKTAEEIKRANDQMLRTPSQLVGMKGSAKTLNELRLYAEQLRKTMNTLNPKSAEWNKLNRILQQTEGQISRVENKMKGVNATSGTLKNALSGVGRMFATAFAVERVWQYSKAIVSVTGEFEQMQVALRTIIGNIEAANDIWNQTMELARNSPFQARELIRYTRQLAAYRIESDKLYDTTKMLADVSAGLGVDMSRLILAYGQVRAAEYLRGTELRQFTEAGVPMLEELAKHFTELEGVTVSTADAFAMISKRQVAFSDVEAVLERMTSEGGPFYKMQEVMSNTVKGSISNLKDEVDLMMYEIGQDNDGIIKGFINLLRTLVKNWRYVAAAIKTVTVALVSYTIATKVAAATSFMAGLRITSLTRAMVVARTAIRTATASIKGFFAALGPIGWATVIISTLATAFFSFRSASEEMDDTADRAKELEQELENINNQYNDINKSVRKYREAFDQALSSGNLTEMEVQLTRMIELAKEEYSIIFDIQVKGASEEELKAAMNDVENTLNEASTFGRQFQTKFEYYGPDGQYKGFDVDFKKLEKYLLDEWDRSYAEIKQAVKSLMANTDEDIASLFHEYKAGEDPLQYMYDYYYNLLSVEDDINLDELGIYSISSEYIRNISKKFADVKAAREKIAYNLYLQMGGGEEAWGENLSTYLAGALTNLISRNQIDERALASWKEALKESFGVDEIDVTLDDGMQDWENEFNKFLEERWETTKKSIETANLTAEASLGDSFRLNGIVVKALDADNKKTRPELAKALKEMRDIQKAIIDAVAAGADSYTEAEAKVAQIKFDQYDALVKWLEGDQTNGLKKKLEDANKKRIDLLKKMNSQYLSEFKTFGDEAEPIIRAAYEKAFGEVFKGTNIKLDGIDFTSKTGMVDALKKLRPLAAKAGKDAVDALETEIAKFEAEIRIEDRKDLFQETLDDIDELFDSYELSLEIKKLNIPPDVAKSLFGEEFLTLDELKIKTRQEFIGDVEDANKAKTLTDELSKGLDEIDWNIVEGILGTDQMKELKKALEKIDDIEDKAAKERMKTYSKYLVEGMNDRVKLKIEEMRKLKEVEESPEFTPEQKEQIKKQISAEAREEQDKQEWESFKGTEMYTMMFDDIELLGTKALGHLQTKLEELKSSLADLPASEVKEIVRQISKIEDIIITKTNPFKYMRELRDELKGMKSEEDYQIDLVNAQSAQEDAQKAIDAINTVKNAQLEHGESAALELVDEETLRLYNELTAEAARQGKTIEEILKDKEALVKKSKEEAAIAADGINVHQRAKKALEQQAKVWGEYESKASEAFDVTRDLMETLGADTDGVAMSLVDSSESLVMLTFQAIQFGIQMQIAGYQANMALGVIGWILIAVQAIATILAAIFSAKDKALQKEIEGHLDDVETLKEEYEELEELMNEAWNTQDIAYYNAEMKKTMNLAIEAQKAAIKAQESRKGANKEGSDAYEELQDMKAELEEMENTLAESLEESFSKVTDGILDKVLDAAKDFTDAWYDAFKETGDGLSGLEENFEEMFMNLAKNQAAMQITGAFTEQWKEALKDYINDEDTELTKEEAAAWAKEVRASFPELNAALEAFLGTISDGLGGKSGSLSELQKGIQGVTEETAQVLESLLNSMRYYVVDSNTQLHEHTRILKDIYSLINGLTTSAPSRSAVSGRVLKIAMA